MAAFIVREGSEDYGVRRSMSLQPLVAGFQGKTGGVPGLFLL